MWVTSLLLTLVFPLTTSCPTTTSNELALAYRQATSQHTTDAVPALACKSAVLADLPAKAVHLQPYPALKWLPTRSLIPELLNDMGLTGEGAELGVHQVCLCACILLVACVLSVCVQLTHISDGKVLRGVGNSVAFAKGVAAVSHRVCPTPNTRAVQRCCCVQDAR